MGYKMQKEGYEMIAQLKEFKLQAEEHLSVAFQWQKKTTIYTEGHLLIFHWKKKKKKR